MLLCAVIVAGFASVLVTVLGGSAGAQVTPLCTPTNPQPAAPLEMNTVVIGSVAKTVAMEKELFDCQDSTGAQFARDVETFVEILETGTATNISTAARRVIIATCDKNFVPTGRVLCKSKTITLTAPVANPLAGCRQFPAASVLKTPADPVEMNTVVVGDVVKTIKVEKEVLDCGTFVGEVYLFTEVIELRTAAQPVPATIATRFDGIMCRKTVQLGDITSCTRFTTT
jgi:hypothetical protein